MTTGPCPIEELSPEARARLEGVLARMRAGESDGIAELEALLAEAPAAVEVIGHLAWAQAHAGRHERAIELYEQALRVRPGDLEMRWRIGDRLVNLGRLEEAEAAYRAVLEAEPACLDATMGVRYVQHLRRREAATGRRAERYVPQQREPTDLQRANEELNRREIARRRLRLESMPPALYLESTTKCNFFCRTCVKGYGPYHAEDLRGPILERVRDEVLPTNARISITGFGEPTMAENFDGILRMALENGSLVHFVTNASLLNVERIEHLTRCPVDISISIDGATRGTFEEIRAGSNFELTIEKLAMIAKLRDIHLSRFFSRFGFIFVALRRNIDELPDVVRLAHRFGIGLVHVADYAPNANEYDEQSLRYDAARANARLEEARRVAQELGVHLVTPPPYEEPGRDATTRRGWRRWLPDGRVLPARDRFAQRCHSPWREPYIHTDGRVTPCCASGQYLGNVAERPFRAIWNGWRYRLLRWRVNSPIPRHECRVCFVAWGINGGNAANAMAREGLLVKAWYRGEAAVKALARHLRRLLRPRPTPAPEPNFLRGRPIATRNRMDATPPT